MSTRTHSRSKDFRDAILAELRANATLCGLLNYDPATETGPAAKIQEADPPWPRTHDTVVVVDPQTDGADPNNAADDQSFTCEVTLMVSSAWYKRDFMAGQRYDIFDEIEATMTRPSIPGLRNVRGIEFNRSEAGQNYERAWTAVFNYVTTVSS